VADEGSAPSGEPWEIRIYWPGACAPFRRQTDPLAALSNMAEGMPLVVSGIAVGSSEALYQCMRFPHLPEVQRSILAAPTPATAKEACALWRARSRTDWDAVRVDVMRWCLSVKLEQHAARLGPLLQSTGELPIVEVSARDDFWGAKPRGDGAYVGRNVLGRLLTELRSPAASLPTTGSHWRETSLLLGRPVAVDGHIVGC